MKRKVKKAIWTFIRLLIEILCGTSLLGIPALMVHNGYNMPVPGLLMIGIPLAIPLAICLVIDYCEERKAQDRRMDAAIRRHEKEKRLREFGK